MVLEIVNQHQEDLAQAVIRELRPRAVGIQPNFDAQLPPAATLCWLPAVMAPVDELVNGLVSYVDQSPVPPQKLVVLTAAGICGDLTSEQEQQLYGKHYEDVIYAHQYAVKMIDELELPYTAVRVPEVIPEKTKAAVTAEGEPLAGLQVGRQQLASLLATAMTTDRYVNQSIGLGGQKNDN